ncbi:hypothetical protein [Roseospira visakhapatnamensis]|uniref:Uncharacterized protein n=1 Tax=Roseospira visakhapatnamensis TaxID=390880 RepID=A0A7W6RF86_9PROT|nr:hypothetical protein [Roseospira visakhapatnamensis]MBB4266971.1 hypothetical protein [Roseospira visakhapatnamensis]
MGTDTPRALTAREWAALARAIDRTDPEACRALDQLARHHGLTLDDLDTMAGAARPPVAVPVVVVPPPPEPPPALALEADLALEPDLAYPDASDPAPHWEVIADREDLRIATAQMGLDSNVVRPTADGSDDEAMVSHPSVFCPDGPMFLGVLAVLVRRGALFRLYQARRTEDGAAETVQVRLFPEPGSETMEILTLFHPETARTVKNLSTRVADAMRLLQTESPS